MEILLCIKISMLKRIVLSFMALVSALMINVSSADAANFFNEPELVIDELVSDDTYILSDSAHIKNTIVGDVFILAGEVTIDGDITEDLFVASGEVVVNGNVSGDIRVAGGEVTINGAIGDDLMAAGGDIVVGEDSTIGGSIFAASGSLEVNGRVFEDVKGNFAVLYINSEICGDVDVRIDQSLEFGPKAKLKQDLRYLAPGEDYVPTGVVEGEITSSTMAYQILAQDFGKGFVIWQITAYGSSLILALMLVSIAPRMLTRTAQITKEHPWKTLGFGLLVMLLAFVIPIILMMTIIGIGLSFISMAIFFIMFMFAKVFAANWIGAYIIGTPKMKKSGKKVVAEVSRLKQFGVLALVLLAYNLLIFIPFVGWVAKLILFVVGLGSMVMMKVEYWRVLRQQELI